MTKPYGLLLATMEPAPGIADEFQQWYDTEHFPERQRAEGFRTAARFVCLDGWPRYLALYDLDSIGVLHAPPYVRLTKGSTSRWAGWIMPQVTGLLRAEGIQIYPGQAQLGDGGGFTRLGLWRFRDVPAAEQDELVTRLRAVHEGADGLAQLRVFQVDWAEGTDILALVELRGPGPETTTVLTALGNAARHVDLHNVYARYWHGDPRTTVARDPDAS